MKKTQLEEFTIKTEDLRKLANDHIKTNDPVKAQELLSEFALRTNIWNY